MFGRTYQNVNMEGFTTSLVTKQIGDPMEAVKNLNDIDYNPHQQIKYVPMVLVPSRLPCSLFMCVPDGFKALVFSHGKYIETWDAGFHCAAPWTNIQYLIGLQHYIYDTPVKECPTLDNVMVTIDITLVFHVEPEEQKLRDFAFKLGPEGLDQMLQQIQQDSVRSLVRQRTYDQVYDLMTRNNVVHDDALSGTRKDLNTALAEYGVVVSDLNITNVHLPSDMHKSMQTSTIYHNENEYAKLKQEHEVLLIDNDEIEKKEIQLMKEKLEQFEAERKNALAKEQAEYKIIRAETKKILAEIKEQENADVKRIHADSRLFVSGIVRKKDVSLSTIKAEGRAEADQLMVEARAFEIQKRAEADRNVAERKAEALTIEADAEEQAARLLVSQRMFREKMRHLQVIEGLSTNRDVSISGNNGDNYVAQMVSGGRQAAILGVQNSI